MYTQLQKFLSRLVTALHSKSESVSFIILTVMFSSELDIEIGRISTVSNVALLSLSVLGDSVPLTFAVGARGKFVGMAKFVFLFRRNVM